MYRRALRRKQPKRMESKADCQSILEESIEWFVCCVFFFRNGNQKGNGSHTTLIFAFVSLYSWYFPSYCRTKQCTRIVYYNLTRVCVRLYFTLRLLFHKCENGSLFVQMNASLFHRWFDFKSLYMKRVRWLTPIHTFQGSRM